MSFKGNGEALLTNAFGKPTQSRKLPTNTYKYLPVPLKKCRNGLKKGSVTKEIDFEVQILSADKQMDLKKKIV